MSGSSGRLPQHERERPGPEARGERACGRRHATATQSSEAAVGQVDDQRVERRPRLRLEDARDRARVEGVGAEPVDGLGGEGHEPAPLQHRGRIGEARGSVAGRMRAVRQGRLGGVRRPPRAREAQHAAGGVDVGAARVAAHEADAVPRPARRGSAPRSASSARTEAPGRVVHVDHGERARATPRKSRRQLARLLGAGVDAGHQHPGQVHGAAAARRVPAHGRRQLRRRRSARRSARARARFSWKAEVSERISR